MKKTNNHVVTTGTLDNGNNYVFILLLIGSKEQISSREKELSLENIMEKQKDGFAMIILWERQES